MVAGQLEHVGRLVTYTPVHRVIEIIGMGPRSFPALLDIPLRKVGDLDRALEMFGRAPQLHPPAVGIVVSVFI